MGLFMTVLAKLRRIARPLAIVIAALTIVGAANAEIGGVHEKESAGADCHSETQADAPVSAEQSSSNANPESSPDTHCCQQDCHCPFATGAYALPLPMAYVLVPTTSNVQFPPVLALEDRRPSDLLRPPI